MANSNYFKAKAAMKKINQNLRATHPDWSAKKVYAATKAIYNNQTAEPVAGAAAEPAMAMAEEQ